MGNIVLLDDLTINKIAAGEVIERPASVIKEMVENSIDAGATNITVEIKNGGISFIKISDNGKGIAQDDLEIAFERHATSKIRSADDLNNITSMGFRGEALASIGAISNVEMISKTREQENGYKVVVEAGNILEKEISPASVGTTITVKNLFFNTPVRYKFLKKDYTESGYIEDVITRIALVNPQIAIKLINTGKTIIQTNGNGDLKTVIYSIFGKSVAEAVLPVSYEYEDIKVEGMVGKPEVARSNRTNQLFFVNKRYIKDKTLTAATEQAYKGMIPLGKFGFVVLNITMNPAKVDVNVHPAKLEVRFQEENKVFQAIYHAIKDTLLKNGDNQGFFGLRRTDDNQIRQYTETESNIKTNMPDQTHNIETSENKSEQKTNPININPSGPIDTDSILEQLINLRKEITGSKEENIEDLKLALQSNNNIGKTEQQNNINLEGINHIEQPSNTDLKEIKIAEQSDNVNLEKNKNTEQVNSDTNIEELKKDTQKTYSMKEILQRVKDSEEKQQNNKTSSENNSENEIDNLIKLKDIPNKLQENETNEKVDFDEMYQKLFGKAPIKQETEEKGTDATDIIQKNLNMFEEIPELKKQPYKIIGIVFNTYIIIEMNQEMYIIDQHAAHERVLYEKVKKNYYSNSTRDSQMLLLPDIITLTHKEMDIAKENLDMFRKVGFDLEEFGENTIKLTGVPTICVNLDNKELFLETLDEINTVARTAKQEKEEKFIATVACKAAVKANMALTTEEVQSLIDKMLELPNPFSCPHGRPTAIKMSKYDIERKFARK